MTNIIIYCSIIMLVYITIIYIYNRYTINKRYKMQKKVYDEFQSKITVDSDVIFCAGICGHIIKVSEKWAIVRIEDGTQMKILRSAITEVLTK